MKPKNCQPRKVLTFTGLLRTFTPASTIVLATCLTACGGSGGFDPVTHGHGPSSSRFLYISTVATGGGSGAVLQYAIGADGSLTPLTVPSVPAGTDPVAIASDPAGQYVYAVNGGDRTISQYSVGAGGQLTPLSPAVVSIPISTSQGGSFWVSVDPSGHYLYAVSSLPGPTTVAAPASIAQYSINHGGLLTPLTPASVTVSNLASGPLVIDPSGRHAYLGGSSSGVVLQFSLGSGGTLSALAPAGVAADKPTGVVLAPKDEAAYVLGTCVDNACDGQVSLYMIQSDGSLSTRVFSTLMGSHILPVDMVLNGSGSSAYLLTNLMGVDTNLGKLYPFGIDSAGALMSQGEVDIGSAAIAEALNGSNLYVLTSDALASVHGSGGHLARFALASGGTSSQIDSTPITGRNPTAMTLVIAP